MSTNPEPRCPKCGEQHFMLEEWGTTKSYATYIDGKLKVNRGEADIDEARLYCAACGHQFCWVEEQTVADTIHELFE